MVSDLTDRVILITGATGGIGRAAALCFARRGARVVIGDLADCDGEELVQAIGAIGGKCWFQPIDVTDEDSVASAISHIVARCGRLDGAFNNAGIGQAHLPLHKLSLEQWSKVIAVNLTGVFLCLRYEIAAMLGQGGGSIVNTSSTLGQVAVANSSEYIAAKHGVIGLTRAAAVETAKAGIRVNAILPGVIQTPMVERAALDPHFDGDFDAIRAAHPMGRLGEASEVASVAAWLLSSDASLITGALIATDGGYLAV